MCYFGRESSFPFSEKVRDTRSSLTGWYRAPKKKRWKERKERERVERKFDRLWRSWKHRLNDLLWYNRFKLNWEETGAKLDKNGIVYSVTRPISMKIRSFLRRYFTSYELWIWKTRTPLSLFFSPRYIATNPINSSVYKKRNHGYNRTVESGTKGKRKKEWWWIFFSLIVPFPMRIRADGKRIEIRRKGVEKTKESRINVFIIRSRSKRKERREKKRSLQRFHISAFVLQPRQDY